ncbi:WASH complex subunit 2-like isoform X3 [Phoenix dactylifera]|uniref:WASH complex subunit 2-like isoform X3 n=1 Tax=Phoenix dactylifera TaxID=42345 RepID=A0A8B9ALT0_PHODC|nr:WASH complex subunit 2-like isoform X3 [Phoenix dactylifera]
MQVLKWLSEFSEKLQKRADNATMEINGLLDEAGVVELDLKNTYNSFRTLSYHQFVDHKISDEDDVDSYMKDSAKSSVQADIPAQDYETDILPRYKEALSLGLTSCRSHLQSTKKSHLTTSVFRTGLANGPLPHIIGSEEYMHDNSCGLTEDFALGTLPLDFSWIVDSKGTSSEAEGHGPSDLFSSPMSGMQQGLSEKDGTEPLVSAALDFKAMLEAALLNPYKFYDEENLSANNAVSDDRGTGQTHMDAVIISGAPEAVSRGSPRNRGVIEEKAVPATEGNLTSLQDPDIHANELYSALVSGSLFDAEGEEDSLSFCQNEPDDISASVADSISAHASMMGANEIVDGTQSLNIHENLGSSDQSTTVHVSADTSVGINEEGGQKAPLGDVNALEKDGSLMSQTLSSHKLKDASSSFVTSSDDIRSHN